VPQDPHNAPLVLAFGGGPGASGMLFPFNGAGYASRFPLLPSYNCFHSINHLRSMNPLLSNDELTSTRLHLHLPPAHVQSKSAKKKKR